MRAFVIDAEHRTVTEITTPGDWDTIRDLLNTNRIAIAAPAFVSHSDGGTDVVYYDDYQDEAGEDPRGWYQVDADLNSRLSPPRAGRALVIGVDHGKPYPAGHGVTFYEDLVGADGARHLHTPRVSGLRGGRGWVYQHRRADRRRALTPRRARALTAMILKR